MSNNPANRRKNYFVKRKFQTDFFIKFIALLFLEAVLIAALFMFAAKDTLTTAYRGAELTIQHTGPYFLTAFLLIITLVGAAIGIAGVFVFMYLTHRIGGALYKCEKVISDVIKGDLTQRIQLRKTDELAALKDDLNGLFQKLDQGIAKLKDETDTLAKSDIKKIDAAELKEKLRSFRTSLDHFKTSD
ncbi:MAG TPA: methyl-accepting chemotaxis protein [Candidatus Omnitrophota bacterium]|nr:methyl-accepting chemotaxis protein [Candidatus Omnitrophota bacterium]HPS20796.1 methyl-accepting chemotaxis protein [Candidatus Omnitrophota bacterium]